MENTNLGHQNVRNTRSVTQSNAVDDANENLNAYWDELKAGLDKVFYLKELSKKEYVEIYTKVYNYCTHVDRARNPGSLSGMAANPPTSVLPIGRGRSGTESSESSHSRRTNRTSGRSQRNNHSSGSDGPIPLTLEPEKPSDVYSTVAGVRFYGKVREYLKHFVSQVRSGAENLHDEQLLEYFHKKWHDYRFSSRVLNGLLAYFNNYFIARQRNEGKSTYVEIFQLALNTWKDNLVKNLAPRILEALLQEVKRERRYEISSNVTGGSCLTLPSGSHSNAVGTSSAALSGFAHNDLAKIVQCYVEISGNEMVSSSSQDFFPNIYESRGVLEGINAQALCSHLLLASKQLQNSTSLNFGRSATGSEHNPSIKAPYRPTLGNNLPTTGSTSYVAHHYSPEAPPTPRVYMDHLEKGYLMDMKRFYETESEEFLKQHSVTEYMRKAECRILEEISRVHRCLHPTSHAKVLFVCEKSLVSRHKEVFIKEFDRLLAQQNVPDLSRLYNLMSLTQDSISVLVLNMEAHVITRGRQAVEAVASKAIQDARVYVQTLLTVYKDYERLVQEAFQNNPEFSGSLDKGCSVFMNRNKVTEMAKDSRKSPELLAKYCDLLLKKGHRDAHYESEESLFKDAMIVHKYLDDKDVFQKFYSKLLCRRLVNGCSISDESEEDMISRLKEACGYEYTSKLQRMSQDMATSQELREPFRLFLAEKKVEAERNNQTFETPSFDFNMMVLATNAWPLSPMENILLPPEMQVCHDRFIEFYSSKHNGRKLSWIFSIGRGDLSVHYLRTRYTFQVSSLQMVVLLVFNNVIELTCSQLLERTGIQWYHLTQVLSSLIKSHVFRITDSSPAPPPAPTDTATSSSSDTRAAPQAHTLLNEFNLQPHSSVALNMEFKNKKVRVNLNVPFKAEQKQEAEQTIATVEHDRKMVIEATIVRIMKARQELQHQQLITEVISLVGNRFQPVVSMIKRSIDSLMEREYITRKENDRETYVYMA